MNRTKMQHHIEHLEQKHQKLNEEIDSIERTGSNPRINLNTLKKERLHLKDEIERCRHKIENSHD